VEDQDAEWRPKPDGTGTGAVAFTPLPAEAARPCRHLVGDRWSVDETYVKVAGRWRDVDRAVDQAGQVTDVVVSPRRDARAARGLFERAVGAATRTPVQVVTDQAATYRSCWRGCYRSLAWHRSVCQ
jgi:transposase-like protein